MHCLARSLTSPCPQIKKLEVSLEGLQAGNDPRLPPLMNPAMLEASDDLTNLSHLNEPAGNEALCLLTLGRTLC